MPVIHDTFAVVHEKPWQGESKTKSTKKLVIASTILILLLMIIATIIFLIKQGNSNENSSVSTPTPKLTHKINLI